MEYLEERKRGELVHAWYNALLYRQDPKKLPKRAEQLWEKDAADQTIEQMKMLVTAWASNAHEVLKKKNP